MVIPDINTDSGAHFKANSNFENIHIASSQDRLLAFFLDFLIIAPICSLFAAVHLRDLRGYMFESGGSSELVVTELMLALIVVLSTSVISSLMLSIWGFTPGQWLLQVRVKNMLDLQKEKLPFTQGLWRNLGWWFSGLVLFVPILEVFSHPWRRTFYDRFSDTVVVTLKSQDSRPWAFEMQVVNRWLKIFTGGMFLIGLGYLAQTERETLEAQFSLSQKLDQGLMCQEIDKSVTDMSKRLDLGLALFLSKKISEDCLEQEADFALWQKKSGIYPQAYLAKGLLAQAEKDRESYFSLTCKDADQSEFCLAAKYTLEPSQESLANLRGSGLKFKSSLVMIFEQELKTKNTQTALVLAKNLLEDPELSEVIQDSLVRLMWTLREAKDRRAPAGSGSKTRGTSTDTIASSESGDTENSKLDLDYEEVLLKFNERYGIQ